MATRAYCPDCAHEAHSAGRCQSCWSDGSLTTRRPKACTASLDAQSTHEEDRLRVVAHDRPDAGGATSPDWWKRVMAAQSKSGLSDDEAGGR